MKVIGSKEMQAQVQSIVDGYVKAEKYVEEIVIGAIQFSLATKSERDLLAHIDGLVDSLFRAIREDEFIPGAVEDGEDERSMTSFIGMLQLQELHSLVMNAFVEVVLTNNGVRVSSNHSENIQKFAELVGVTIEDLGNGQMSLTFPESN